MRLCTLGDLRVEGVAFKRLKPLLLLTYVALEGPKSRRHLADLFFMGTRDPRDNLSTALARLKPHLGEALQLDGERVWTTLPCDAQKLLEWPDVSQFEEILQVYQGPFLDGLDLELGEELEEWVFSMREHFASHMREVNLRKAELELTRSRLVEARAYAEAALKLPGAPELEENEYARIHSLLTLCSSPSAKRVFEEAAALGITLEQRPQHTGKPSRVSEPDQPTFDVPVRKLSFVGRDSERSGLRRLLADPQCHLVTLHGPGGVGKSRLAIQAAYDQRDLKGFPDGIFFVLLESLTSRDEVVARLTTLFGVTAGGDVTHLAERIGTRTILLILDNYEHLVTAFDVPDMLVMNCPNLKVLVTSRETLNLEQEWFLPLHGLTFPAEHTSPDEARCTDALVLFEQRAKKVKPDFILAGASLKSALQLCQLVEGYPLEIELAAAWAHAAPLEDLLTTLREDPSLLRATSRDTPERHRSVEHVFEQSWRLLSAAEQRAVAHLSVFQGGFTRHAASRIADVTLPLLATLMNKSFFWLTDRGRYEQHRMLRQFACKKLLELEGADAAIFTDHCAYYSDFVERYSEGSEAIKAIGQELDNILAAASWAHKASRLELFVRAMHLLTREGSYFAARGHTEGSLLLLEKAGEAAEQLGDPNTAHYLIAKAGDAYRELRGDLARATNAYERALELVRLAKNPAREVTMLSLLGTVGAFIGHPHAHTFLEAAYTLAASMDDRLALCHVLQNRSCVEHLHEDWEAMHDSAQEAVTLARQASYCVAQQESLFFGLLNWGEAYYRLNNFEAARELYSEALGVAQELGNELWLGHVHYQLGDLYYTQKTYGLADMYFRKALSLYRKNNVLIAETGIPELIDAIASLQSSQLDTPQN